MHCHAIQWFFCAILLWGKIMAAVHLCKRSALNKCPACRLLWCTLCCLAKYAQLHLKASRVLQRSSDQDNSRSIRGAPQACFGFHEFSPFFMGKLVFLFSLSWSYLKAHLRPREEWLCKGNWPIPRRRLIVKLETGEEKKCGKGLLFVGWRRGLKSRRRHFRPQKIDIKSLNSVTVHL